MVGGESIKMALGGDRVEPTCLLLHAKTPYGMTFRSGGARACRLSAPRLL